MACRISAGGEFAQLGNNSHMDVVLVQLGVGVGDGLLRGDSAVECGAAHCCGLLNSNIHGIRHCALTL